MLIILLALLVSSGLCAQTIEEKKQQSLQLSQGPGGEAAIKFLNEKLHLLRTDLEQQMTRADQLIKGGAKDEEYALLLETSKALRSQIVALQEEWRQTSTAETKRDEEGYALWDQEETTLASLVMEYGASDFLYVVPPEMAGLKLSLHSNIQIPRESWNEVLEIILAQNGIGVKPVNPYAKQLFILKQDPSSVQVIASRLEDIQHVQDQRRIFFVFSPPPEQAKTAFQFFERFSDPKQTFIYNIAGKVAIVSSRSEIEKLLQLYNTVWQDPKGKVSKVVTITKMNIKEMERILQSFFSDGLQLPGRPPFGKVDQDALSIFAPTQGNALVLMGSKDLVERAEKIVKDTEAQLQDPAEMTVFLYTCKHSDPNDLAKTLDKVYYSLLYALPEGRENVDVNYTARGSAIGNPPDGYAPAQPLVVPPQQFKPEISSKLGIEQNSDHFIPDPKTGNLLMVVRRDVLQHIKELLRRLDIPKRMVQIEVLLFEKKLKNQANYGLNLLKLGHNHNGARYDGPHPTHRSGLKEPVGRGVLEFLFSGDGSKYFPAFDFAYSFLMTQEDIQLNAAPSVITVNQTPATISILEEISLNNGAAPVDSNKGTIFEKSFTRAQYGITIIITPIVHLPDDDDPDGKGFVTLQTNITFDTTKHSHDDRPPVHKRHIENEVRVVDGQTVILGGLRRKAMHDNQDKIPFLGDIPGLGKLFGSNELTDDNTEMFFFITPKIINDPKEELIRLRREELCMRPGDIPEFLEKLVEARERESQRQFANSARMLWGDRLCR